MTPPNRFLFGGLVLLAIVAMMVMLWGYGG